MIHINSCNRIPIPLIADILFWTMALYRGQGWLGCCQSCICVCSFSWWVVLIVSSPTALSHRLIGVV